MESPPGKETATSFNDVEEAPSKYNEGEGSLEGRGWEWLWKSRKGVDGKRLKCQWRDSNTGSCSINGADSESEE